MSISGTIPHAGIENINIPLNGRNLIITGKNGSGKTSFLNLLTERIKLHLEKENQLKEETIRNLDLWNNIILTHTKGTHDYSQAERQINYYQERLKKINSVLQLQFKNELEFIASYDNFKSIFTSFNAIRIASIKEAKQTSSIEYEIEEAKKQLKNKQIINFGTKLEQHLINIKVSQSLAITEDKNEIQAKKFSEWFEKFDSHLKFLFEDESTKLVFYRKNYKFKILQNNREFDFQTLSSGYLAIFDILADLLIRTEFFDITPEELEGIVLIDEIDAHLHISLQKKILPFFTRLFPQVQFIVSTHSPFVITSTDKYTTVYDISSGEFFENDLSLYSYESVIKGLFHIDTKSDQLKIEIQTIATILNSEPNNYEKLRETLRNITPYAKQLDVESKSFYFKALNHLLDNQELGDLDV
ncbi:ATP-binding protein [Acinetobacter pittii]|uniref:AAA family ATPase n=1 Tax=Acinetobacter pittii TaxID=48296 RepID=UPI001EE52048|nr:AAA family ATPase [Acinetobacter pittii]MCG5265898.1 ATP-binding protein [Acinetobacter pittii]